MNSIATALVAEDDRALADIIRVALTRAGFQVKVAHDGKKALSLAESKKFDVIVSDYQMPLLDGEQVLAGARASATSHSALLVLCSAKSYEFDSERLSSKLGLTAIFYKPFSLQELVKTLLQAHHAAAAVEPEFVGSNIAVTPVA
jgi:DNA-binding response OmpR family regulator